MHLSVGAVTHRKVRGILPEASCRLGPRTSRRARPPSFRKNLVILEGEDDGANFQVTGVSRSHF